MILLFLGSMQIPPKPFSSFKADTFKIAIAALLLLLTCVKEKGFSQAIADPVTKSWSVSINPGICNSNVTDNYFSKLPYKGITASIIAAVKHTRALTEHDLILFYTKGDLQTDSKPRFKLNQTILNIDYSILYSINTSEDQRFKLKAGVAGQLFFGDRVYHEFINQNNSFENAISLGGTIKLVYELPGIFSDFSLSNQLMIPVAFAYSQPSSANSAAEGRKSKTNSGFNNFFQFNKFATIPDIFRIKNYLAIERKLNSKNTIALSYFWDCYSVRTGNKVVQANHQLGVLYRYTF